MSSYLHVREFQYGDLPAVRALVRSTELERFKGLFLDTLFRETTLQMLVVVSGVLFIFCGVPLHLCWVSFPALALLLFLAIYIGLHRDVVHNIRDLDNVEECYLFNPRTNFWVAEVLEEKSVAKLGTTAHRTILQGLKKKVHGIIGVCAIEEKIDKNMNEPAHTVGLLKRMAVEKSLRRIGIGEELHSVMWSHCLAHFRAIEVLIPEHHVAGRNFFEKQEFTILNQEERSPIPAIFSNNLLRLRRACVVPVTEDDLLETVVQ